ncbi:Ribose 5-phosphate isomerase B [Carbonactinospora thermoautotrophica]|uniref:Ribose 5-phosphate isomerase B n=1 Tax=Carbonactinospora thermoautotrophica TaxID=1469144 RepID=A0A132MW11_9ACTN|nr:Ribose 5-phosphate isomerase B [Carbonactinospora thermoautotrophica]
MVGAQVYAHGAQSGRCRRSCSQVPRRTPRRDRFPGAVRTSGSREAKDGAAAPHGPCGAADRFYLDPVADSMLLQIYCNKIEEGGS